ncbi:MAG: TonB-dependent receptor plug domain-containing protein [Paludibacteraceae bacterium]|nr:TonB-dependent receptor plug domain-containing protein [Paludibacteraceae bacterium]
MKQIIGLIIVFGILPLAVPLQAAQRDSLRLDSIQQALVDSIERMFTLQEVVVTAEEKTSQSSASVIGKEAMQHLQPSSFTDILQTLPGGTTKDPNLTQTNTIRLREASNGSGSSEYDASSLGTSFVVDGAPVSTDANMQYVQSDVSGADAKRSSVGAGVDMRTISTDDIEKVEIIRGIAGAEYGDVTSGVVKIERTSKPTPWRARFKADGFTKLLFFGKGIGWSDNRTVLNFGVDYLNAKADPTNTLENYQRITASVRLQQRWEAADFRVRWQSHWDYTGSIDNEKIDPDIHNNREDSYRSQYHKLGWNNTVVLNQAGVEWWRLSVQANISGEIDRIDQTRFVQLTTPKNPAIDNMQEGEATVGLLPYKYTAWHTVEGLPMNVFVRPKAEFYFNTWRLEHKANIGIEWRYAKNFGRGQVYDLSRPLNYSSQLRPRAYYDIPATNQLAWYIQDEIKIQFTKDDVRWVPYIDLNIGLRGTSLLGLGSEYAVSGKCYLDPRANLTVNFPFAKGKVYIAGAVGQHTKMPTLLQLSPNLLYMDLQAPDKSISPTDETMQIYTHIVNPANYSLQPARNLKWEVRAGLDIQKHRLSITYFEEDMRDAFRGMLQVEPFRYSIDGNTYNRLLPYSTIANGSRIHKQGVEWQYQSPRIPVICTRFTLNGAWLRTTYSNSERMYSTEKSAGIVNGVNVQDHYIGLYDWTEGYIRESLNSNLVADVYIRKIGLTVSATLETTIYTASKTLEKNGMPVAYISSEDGQLHPYGAAEAQDAILKTLIFDYNTGQFIRRVVPFEGYLNLRVQKSITRFASIALYVNRLLDILPDYQVSGANGGQVTIHRTSSPYFGMEVNLNI